VRQSPTLVSRVGLQRLRGLGCRRVDLGSVGRGATRSTEPAAHLRGERYGRACGQRSAFTTCPPLLRHRGAAAGVPAKVVSERLGHANIAITMDTYSHVLPGMDELAASTSPG
jgi:integrase